MGASHSRWGLLISRASPAFVIAPATAPSSSALSLASTSLSLALYLYLFFFLSGFRFLALSLVRSLVLFFLCSSPFLSFSLACLPVHARSCSCSLDPRALRTTSKRAKSAFSAPVYLTFTHFDKGKKNREAKETETKEHTLLQKCSPLAQVQR
jgi:hypothetical protein